MGEWYLGSLLVMAGACIAFGVHAGNLAVTQRSRRYGYLFALTVFEGLYCFVTYRYFSETVSERALPWGKLICLVTPYITYVFGQLTVDVTERRPRWLVLGQHLNLLLTTAFALGVLSDYCFQTRIMIEPYVRTDLASAHRHILGFTPLGNGYLAWVTIAFITFGTLLVKNPRHRRTLAPMTIGIVLYFTATIADFGILTGFRDGHFLQHFGFFALLFGCWRVLSTRFEQLIVDQQAALAKLEAQRQRLLVAAPMLHKQKLDSLGTLAAGVAHEINNPIGGILNYVQLLKKSGQTPAEERMFIAEIEREAKSVAAIVRNLLHFGRADDSHAVAAEVQEVVQNTLTLVRALLDKESIAIRVQIDEEMPVIVCRLQQLQQVLMNLVMNSRDALNRRDSSRTDEKEILIRVQNHPAAGKPNGDYVTFEVVDNGDGFDDATAERIFDPFFTTKPHGEGVGLGLSISHGIMEAHGGRLSCQSEPGKQTRFVAELPCTPPNVVTAPASLAHVAE